MGASILVVVIVPLSGQLASCRKPGRAAARQAVEKTLAGKVPKNRLSQCAWKSGTPRRISTFPQPRRLRDKTAKSEPILCDPSLVALSSASLNRLRKEQRSLQSALYIGGTKDLFLESFFHGSAEDRGAVALQNLVQPIHIVEPLSGPAMDDLGEIE